jgi:putative peptidoglycan lipid II flippase
VTAVLVLIGIAFAPALTATVAVGFDPERRALTVRLIRIMFPAVGLLVCSAWCLGVLNSHRKFLLSYTAPVWWNLVLIATLAFLGPGAEQVRLAVILAWATVLATALQFFVQVPPVLRVAPGLRFSLDTASPHVRTVARNFGPVIVSRGVVQISAYIDSAIASLVGLGAVSIFAYAQAIYLIPGRLFGMSISAAELPAMSSLDQDDPALYGRLCERLQGGLRRIAYFIIPSVAAFLALGDVLALAIFRYGKFTVADAHWVWGTLAGSTVGLLASTMGRLYSSAFYALKDTRTPLRFALIRVALTLALGYLLAVYVPPRLGLSPHWGTAGLTASAGIAGWVEFMLLRRALGNRIGRSGVPTIVLARLWLGALIAAGAAWAVKPLVDAVPNLVRGIVVCGVFGLVYLGVTTLLGEGEAYRVVRAVRRRIGGAR